MAEARNLRNMIQTQTPLLGDENTPLHMVNGGTGFEGATPVHAVSATPNPLATPFRGTGGVEFGATPRSEAGFSTASTPLRTPMRDSLSINPADGGMTPAGETAAQARRRAKEALRRGFAGLPQAQNDFSIELPEEEPEPEAEPILSEEDAAERDARRQRLEEEEAKKALARRSLAVQKGLPRPTHVDLDRLLNELSLASTPSGDTTADQAQRLVDFEFAQLLEHDSIAHPLPGTSRSGAASSSYLPPDDDSLATARSLVHIELATALGFPGANEEQVKRGIVAFTADADADALSSISWAKQREELAYSASTSSWVERDSLSTSERIAGYEALLAADRESMVVEATKASKVEKKLQKTLGGYLNVNGKITKRITDAYEEIQKTERELEAFTKLHEAERGAVPGRIEGLQREVDKLLARERDLQMRYQELAEERAIRTERIETAERAEEERLVREAEAALDAQEAAETAEKAAMAA